MEFIDQLDFERLDLRFEHAALLRQLDLFHKDPFDRLLIAQAMIEKAHIMTNDKIFKKYPAEIIFYWKNNKTGRSFMLKKLINHYNN